MNYFLHSGILTSRTLIFSYLLKTLSLKPFTCPQLNTIILPPISPTFQFFETIFVSLGGSKNRNSHCMSEFYNLSCFDLTYLTNNKSNIVLSICIVNNNTFNIPCNALMNQFLKSFKNDYKYIFILLDLTSKPREKKGLVKFRIGNHKLRIETGRYYQTKG